MPGRSLPDTCSCLLVVLCRHAVQSRIEVLGSRIDGVVGLLEGQGDAATIEINVNHLDEDFFARLDDGLRVLHVAVGQLGDVHEAFDAVFDGDEDTELDDLGDLALDDLARNVGASEALPRIFLGSLEGQGDALTIEVNVEHLDGNLVADLDNLGRVVDVLPRQLGNVDQAVNAARSTNAPKLTMEDTTPSRIWPFLSWDRKVSRTSDWVSSRY